MIRTTLVMCTDSRGVSMPVCSIFRNSWARWKTHRIAQVTNPFARVTNHELELLIETGHDFLRYYLREVPHQPQESVS